MMSHRLLFAASAALSLVVSSATHAGGCTQWRPGPTQPTSVINGYGASFKEACLWDPDGAGPLPPVVAMATYGYNDPWFPQYSISARIITYNPANNTFQQIGVVDPGGQVHAMTAFNNQLLVGGEFENLSPGGGRNFAKFNGTSWSDSSNVPVHCFGTDGPNLLVGTEVQPFGWGYSIGPFFRISPSGEWTQLPQCLPLHFDDAGYCASSYNGQILTSIGRLEGPNNMRWDTCTEFPFGFPARVTQHFNGDLIFAGYSFSYNSIARWTGGQFLSMGNGLQRDGAAIGEVNALCVHNGELYAAGLFTRSGATPISNIARWNGSSWQPLGSGINGEVTGLVTCNGAMYAVGAFTTAGAVPCVNIAKWSNNLWSAVTTGVSMGNVMAMTTFGSKVVATGQFQQMTTGGAQAMNIMAWDGVASSPLGLGLNDRAMALESFTYPGPNGATELIAAGRFTAAGGVAANRIARWVVDPQSPAPPQWAPMGAGFAWEVQALERFNGQTYAAGFFTASGGSPVAYIAKWNEATDVWEPLGTGLNDGAYALKTYGSLLYVGGLFTTAGGVATGGLARWNGSAWSQVGGNFNGIVTALEVHNGELVIGGIYPGINSSPNLAKYNGFSYSTFGTGGTNAAVWSLCSLNGRLYVGGEFNTIGGVPAKKLGVWNGSSWAEVEGGTLSAANRVYALTGFNGEVHAGGTFPSVNNGTLPSPGWARFQSTGTPWIQTQPPASETVACQGDFSAAVQVAAGYDGTTFQWRRNGAARADGPTAYGSMISGALTAMLAVADARAADAGAYDCVITNACGNVTSTVSTVLVANCCAPDLTLDGLVNVSDLLALIGQWGTCVNPNSCPADLGPSPVGDDLVNVADLLTLIAAWGPCP